MSQGAVEERQGQEHQKRRLPLSSLQSRRDHLFHSRESFIRHLHEYGRQEYFW